MSFTIYTKIVQQFYICCDVCESAVYPWPEGYGPTVDEIVEAGKHHDATHPTTCAGCGLQVEFSPEKGALVDISGSALCLDLEPHGPDRKPVGEPLIPAIRRALDSAGIVVKRLDE